MLQRKARQGTKAGKNRHKGRQDKAQMQRQARKGASRSIRQGTKAGKTRCKGRQDKAQRQTSKTRRKGARQ